MLKDIKIGIGFCDEIFIFVTLSWNWVLAMKKNDCDNF